MQSNPSVIPSPPKRSLRATLLATVMGASLVLPSLAPPGALAQQQPAQQGQNLTQEAQRQVPQLLPSLSPIIKKVMPAVVNISVTMKGDAAGATADENSAPGNGGSPNFPPSPFDQFLKRFFEEQQGGPNVPQQPPAGKSVALGSGFIIDPEGYIVTNNHVVGEAGTVTVIFQDDTRHPAKIIGRDPKTDIALIKIDTKTPLPYLAWGDSNAAQVGDWILAIGNPFGLGGTVTTGIVSARGRDIHSGPFDDFLQLDAPINRGNSGGPTFNMAGEVVGINTAIYSPNGGSVGIGFAIPAALAKTVVAQLKDHGKVERGWLGVQIQEMTPEIASSLGLKGEHGALVADVTANSPAAKAGLAQGDVIVKYDGHEIDKVHDLPRLVAQTAAGKTVDLAVWRQGASQSVQATLGQMPNGDEAAANDQQPAAPDKASALGLQFAGLDARLRKQLGLKGDVKGVVVTQIAQDSPVADLGLQPGDVIVAINQQPVTTPAEAAQTLKQARAGGNKHLLLLLNRHGVNEYVGLSVG